MNSMTTLQQRLKTAQTIRKLLKIHEYYLAHPSCTMKQASLFTDESIVMVGKYYAIWKECMNAIESVIDMRYYDRGIGQAQNGAGDSTMPME